MTLILTLFTMCTAAQAKMNKLKFHRYAQPQLKNLITEFFLVLKKLNPHHVYYIDIQRSLTTHIIKLQACDNLKYCTAIDRVARDLNVYERKLWSLQTELLKNDITGTDLDYDELLTSSTHAQKMQRHIYQLKNDIEIFTTVSKNTNVNQIKHKILLELKQILIWAQEGSTSLLSERYRKDFDSLNENFILVIQHHIIIRNDMKFLKGRFNELDNSWNSFNLKVEREVQNFPKSSLSLVRVMRNRWNSILKLILR